MDVRPSLASRLYASLQPAVSPAPPKPEPQAAPGMGETAARAAVSFVDTVRQAEVTAQAGLVGRADPQSVVAALAASEIAVQTAVTVRDKVVEAYQEILRMPV